MSFFRVKQRKFAADGNAEGAESVSECPIELHVPSTSKYYDAMPVYDRLEITQRNPLAREARSGAGERILSGWKACSDSRHTDGLMD